MLIIETCPKCGHDLTEYMITTNPEIRVKECHHCGWKWERREDGEEVMRVPFDPNGWIEHA